MKDLIDAARWRFELEEFMEEWSPFPDRWEFIDEEYPEFNRIYLCAIDEIKKLVA